MAKSAQGARVPRCPSPEYVFRAVLLDFGEGGLVVTREQKLVFMPAFLPYYELSIREADGPSVKCSGAPLFPGGFNGGLKD